MILKKAKLLFLNRSFWPDIESTGQFFGELCEGLSKEYEVVFIAGRSYYKKDIPFKPLTIYRKENFSGIKIIRVRNTLFWKDNLVGRIMNWFTYGVLAFFVLIKETPKLIVVGTDPPFLGIIAVISKWLKSTPFILNCRDLYPDVAYSLNKLNKRNILGRLFDYLNRMALNSSRTVVCIGESMKQSLLSKGIRNEHIRIIHDWVDTSVIKPISKEENRLLKEFNLGDKFIILYSGNLGLSQDFTPFLESVCMIKEDLPLSIVFIGEGAGKHRLQNKVAALGLRNVLFLPYQPKENLSFSLSMADLHLVPLQKGMAGAIVPSKIYGIMAVARPFLAICDKESEPAFIVKEFGCGLWADPNDHESIAKNIIWSISNQLTIKKMGEKGRRLVEKEFNRDIVINRWLELLGSMI
ncbi:MAG: glycosyltransferase family 4 protein [Candidatus Omnitrophica bacterium]|nr:glycosyltransferase family 4 protein [Candidatus Omnitrophota bacterium]